MHFSEILIDNRISCSFVDSEEAENIIFCRPLEESLDNVVTITTKDNEFIHKFITEDSGDKFLVTNIKLSDGEVFNNVKFKLIVCEEGELPESTINTAAFGLPSEFEEITSKDKALVQEEVLISNPSSAIENEEYPIFIKGSFDPIIIEQTKALQEQLNKKQKDLKQKEVELQHRQSVVELNERVQKTLENYKSELLVEYYNTHDKQKDILSSQLNDMSTSLFKYLGEKLKDQKGSNEELLKELTSKNLKQLQSKQDQAIEHIKTEISNLLSEKVTENSDNVDRLLIERTSELQQLFSEKFILELENHKHDIEEEIESINFTIDGLVEEKLKAITEETDKLLVNKAGTLQTEFTNKLKVDLTEHKTNLFNEFKTISGQTATTLFSEKTEELTTALSDILNEHKQNLNNAVTSKINEVSTSINTFKTEIDGKLPQLDETIKEINKRIQTLVIEKKNVQVLADDARKYTDTKVAQASEEMMNYARRILDLGGGGGSVAVQYANGGTMNGNLNVTGQYLSGGVDISTLFGKGGGGGGTFSPYVTGSGAGAIQPLSGNNTASGYYSSILGGQNNNTNGLSATFILGTGITAISADTTYVNNLSTTNSVFTESIIGSGTSEVIIGDGTSECSMGNNTLNLNFSCGVFINGRSISTISGTTSPYVTGGVTGSIQPLSGGNTASGYFSNIGGGSGNNASEYYSNVAGGGYNTASGNYSNVAGGANNTASGNCSSVAGGGYNTASGNYSNVAGGGNNNASGYISNVAGGCCNQAQNDFTVVGGGKSNIASGYASYTGSGAYNCSQSAGSVTVGGYYNTTSATYASIVGGCYNKLTGSMSFIGGGCGNCDNGYNNVFILGCGIIAPQANTTYVNNLSSKNKVIAKEVDASTLSSAYLLGGGSQVVISDGSSDNGCGNSTINLNSLSGTFINSSLGIGLSSYAVGVGTLAVGYSALATGIYSTVAGGYQNCATGNHSFVAAGSGNNDNRNNNTFILGTDIIALSANYTYVNNLSSQGTIAANNITINQSPTTFINPVTASGQFLIVNINSSNKALQLWDYSS